MTQDKFNKANEISQNIKRCSEMIGNFAPLQKGQVVYRKVPTVYIEVEGGAIRFSLKDDFAIAFQNFIKDYKTKCEEEFENL